MRIAAIGALCAALAACIGGDVRTDADGGAGATGARSGGGGDGGGGSVIVVSPGDGDGGDAGPAGAGGADGGGGGTVHDAGPVDGGQLGADSGIPCGLACEAREPSAAYCGFGNFQAYTSAGWECREDQCVEIWAPELCPSAKCDAGACL